MQIIARDADETIEETIAVVVIAKAHVVIFDFHGPVRREGVFPTSADYPTTTIARGIAAKG